MLVGGGSCPKSKQGAVFYPQRLWPLASQVATGTDPVDTLNKTRGVHMHPKMGKLRIDLESSPRLSWTLRPTLQQEDPCAFLVLALAQNVQQYLGALGLSALGYWGERWG